jgi:hypothetical protein
MCADPLVDRGGRQDPLWVFGDLVKESTMSMERIGIVRMLLTHRGHHVPTPERGFSSNELK